MPINYMIRTSHKCIIRQWFSKRGYQLCEKFRPHYVAVVQGGITYGILEVDKANNILSAKPLDMWETTGDIFDLFYDFNEDMKEGKI